MPAIKQTSDIKVSNKGLTCKPTDLSLHNQSLDRR